MLVIPFFGRAKERSYLFPSVFSRESPPFSCQLQYEASSTFSPFSFYFSQPAVIA